jgi:RNA polymerase sigma factor (sigma-70 family)
MSAKDANASLLIKDADNADKFLWNSFRKGSPEAFEVIYKRYSNSMYNYGMHLFMDKTLVEDSIQDVFIEIWNRREYLGDTTSIKFYLLSSLKHKVLRRLATEEKWSQHILAGDFSNVIQESVESQTIFEQSCKSVSDQVKRAIEGLPERQREIIEQRFYNNLSPQEISNSMKLSIDSTYTLLSRAIRELRKNLKKMRLS